MKRFLKFVFQQLESLYRINFSQRFYVTAMGLSVLFVFSFWWPVLFYLANVGLWALGVLVIFEALLLFVFGGISAERYLPKRLSNGDENPVRLTINIDYRFPFTGKWVDEIPGQLPTDNPEMKFSGRKPQEYQFQYQVRPFERGKYEFGMLNIEVTAMFGLVRRHFKLAQPQEVPCYPSFVHLRQYELMAQNTALTFGGLKKFRKIGQQKEFDQIKDYVIGDDIRKVNWAATARKSSLMVNQYQDEKAQQVIALIDGGRNMKIAFDGMDLVDYAINAALVFLNIALKKQDLVGLQCHDQQQQDWLKPSKHPQAMQLIQEKLYQFSPTFSETDFSQVYTRLRHQLRQRSMILLFTNFESERSLERQLPYFRKIARQHLLVVVLFINNTLQDMLQDPVTDSASAYRRGVAEKAQNEKQLMVRRLQQYGIHPILCRPEELTISTVNKYLELKARGLI